MTEERPHDDVLMSAILDEPLPPGRCADPEAVAAHRAAVADITEIRAQLRLLGEALAHAPDPAPDPAGAAESSDPPPDPGSAPAPAPAAPRAPRPAPRRPPGRRDGRRIARRFAAGVSALMCVAALAAGVSWLSATGGGLSGASSEGAEKAVGDKNTQPYPSDPDREGDHASLTPEGFVACSRLIFEGTVIRVEPVPGAPRDRITLDVERHYKPGAGPDRITLTMDHDIDPRLTPGQRTLISVPKGEDHPDNWATGEDLPQLRELVVKALPGSKTTGCDIAGPRG